jgi:hypothetical protein
MATDIEGGGPATSFTTRMREQFGLFAVLVLIFSVLTAIWFWLVHFVDTADAMSGDMRGLVIVGLKLAAGCYLVALPIWAAVNGIRMTWDELRRDEGSRELVLAACFGLHVLGLWLSLALYRLAQSA